MEKTLQTEIFWGYDNDEKSVARTKLNMFLVGDGHIHIYDNDSLVDWNNEIEYKEDEFDYILTNPPIGSYEGEAKITDFDFTNEKRYELMFLEKVVKATKPGVGEIAIIINDGSLESPSRKGFREKLLKNCNINAIISLTKFAFAPYTKEKTYLLFLQKKERNQELKEFKNVEDDIQKFPIWHFILDYDGFANSDKRYRTKYHDDIPELEEKFDGALKVARSYLTDIDSFKSKRSEYERAVNPREIEEGLRGMKYGFVEMSEINESNFFNLLSEFHLRPHETKQITEIEFEQKVSKIEDEISDLIKVGDNK